MADSPLIKLCGLYENVSKSTGKTYFSGVLGGAKVLLLRDDKAAEGQPGWALFVAERPPKRQPQARQQPAGGYQHQALQRPPRPAATRAPAPAGADDGAPFDDDLPF